MKWRMKFNSKWHHQSILIRGSHFLLWIISFTWTVLIIFLTLLIKSISGWMEQWYNFLDNFTRKDSTGLWIKPSCLRRWLQKIIDKSNFKSLSDDDVYKVNKCHFTSINMTSWNLGHLSASLRLKYTWSQNIWPPSYQAHLLTPFSFFYGNTQSKLGDSLRYIPPIPLSFCQMFSDCCLRVRTGKEAENLCMVRKVLFFLVCSC